jgi:TPR repeat protein
MTKRQFITAAACLALILGAVSPAGAAELMRLERPLSSDSDAAMSTIPMPKYTIFGQPLKPKLKSKTRAAAKAIKPVDPMKALRARLVAGKPLTEKQLVRLADSGDSLGAYFLAKQLEGEATPDSASRAAGYYLAAYANGRKAAQVPLIRLLEANALAADEKRLDRAETLLNKRAKKGDTVAVAALTKMYRSGIPFGAQPDAAEALQMAAADGGDAQAALDLAIACLSGTPDDAARAKAAHYLELAARSDVLSIKTLAQNLLRSLEPTPIALVSETAQ